MCGHHRRKFNLCIDFLSPFCQATKRNTFTSTMEHFRRSGFVGQTVAGDARCPCVPSSVTRYSVADVLSRRHVINHHPLFTDSVVRYACGHGPSLNPR